MEDNTAQNGRNLRRLVLSIQASLGRLNLLIAICDNWRYRDELIDTYEAELQAKGTECYRLRMDTRHPSLKQTLQAWAEDNSRQESDSPVVATILGGDELLGLRLNDPKSAQEEFFFSLQWTREALREFQFPIVLWLSPTIATNLAQQAPDFWSWRGGVFEFSRPIAWELAQRNATEKEQAPLPAAPSKPEVAADPTALQQQIDELEAQDPGSPLLPSLYASLGRAYKDAVRYAEAEAPYKKALELLKQRLGDDHPDVATSLNNLANLYYAQGRYSDAEPLFLQDLEITKRTLGDDHLAVATSLNNLANLYYAQGRYSDAEPLFLQAIDVGRRTLSDDHPAVATRLNNLALLYHAQGRYSDAEPLFLQAIEITKHALDDHPDVATSLNNLANLYKAQGRYSDAEPLFLQAIEILNTRLGKDHPHSILGLKNFTNLLKQAIEAGQVSQLSDHPRTQALLKQLQAKTS